MLQLTFSKTNHLPLDEYGPEMEAPGTCVPSRIGFLSLALSCTVRLFQTFDHLYPSELDIDSRGKKRQLRVLDYLPWEVMQMEGPLFFSLFLH